VVTTLLIADSVKDRATQQALSKVLKSLKYSCPSLT
jgi:hypothetical protein